MNVEVLGRIRPPQRGEGTHNLNVQGTKIVQKETHTSHTYDTLYDDDRSNEFIYSNSLSSMVDLMVAGYNCALLSLGTSGSGKSFTLLGDKKSELGIVHFAIRGMLDKINSAIAKHQNSDKPLIYELFLNMYEVCNEAVRDLLKLGGASTTGIPSDIAVTAQDWVHIKEKDEFGYPHQSSFLFVELPGIEKLSENQQDLRKREGAQQNKGISSFGQLVTYLSTRQQADREVDYSDSKVTQLLDCAVGGNCKTKVIMHFNPRPSPTSLKISLTLSNKLSCINNFFIINDYPALSLITQYHAKILGLQSQLGVTTATVPPVRDDPSEDHAKLARDNLKLKEENDYLRRRLDQIQSRFGDVASAKTDLSSKLISSEEEKLKVTKILLDLRIENNKLKERGAQDNFEQRNKILALENRLIQLESERDRLLRDYRHVRDHFDQVEQDRQNVGDRYVDLNADYKALAKKYESEIARNQQLGLELLNLLNAEVTLLKQRDNLGRVGEASKNGNDDLARVRDIALGLSAERQKVSASESEKQDLRKRLFGDQDRFRGEIERMKSHYDTEQDKLQGIINQLNNDLQEIRKADRETKRKLTESEVELLMLRAKAKELQSANSKLQLQMKDKNEEVRARLVKYLQDVADHMDMYRQSSSSTARDGMRSQVDSMMKDLKQTYKTRETQLSEAAREYKHTAEGVAKKHQQLLVEYRFLRQQVLEKNPQGIEPGPEEHILTLDEKEVETADRRELTKVMKQLAGVEKELKEIKKEGSSDEGWRSLKDEFLRNQKDLESERVKLLANNSVLEEQLNEYQDYIHTHIPRYKEEIRRLRRQLGMDDRIELGLADDFGVSRFARDSRPSEVPLSLRKYRTLPEI